MWTWFMLELSYTKDRLSLWSQHLPHAARYLTGSWRIDCPLGHTESDYPIGGLIIQEIDKTLHTHCPWLICILVTRTDLWSPDVTFYNSWQTSNSIIIRHVDLSARCAGNGHIWWWQGAAIRFWGETIGWSICDDEIQWNKIISPEIFVQSSEEL